MGKQSILVLGGTGAQGGSLVKSLLKDGSWTVRVLTRNPESEKSKELAAKGVQIFKGDMSNVDDLRAAAKGVDALFAVTSFWDPSSMFKEAEIGKKIVDVAVELKVKHFIWSTLPNVATISKDKWHVPHFTDKAIVDDYARSKNLPIVSVVPPFYFQNFTSFFPPKWEGETAVFTLPMPEKCFLTAYDVNETGDFVLQVLKNFDHWRGKTVPMIGEHKHPQEYIEIFSKVTGQKARYQSVSVEQFGSFGFPGAKELADMFGYFNEYTYLGPHIDIGLSKKLHPNATSFEAWLKQTGWKGK